MQRSITIDAPAYVVFGEVTDLQTWHTWATWWEKDTTIVTEYTGERYGKDAKMSWTGVDGFGSLEITAVSFADSINTELNFEGMPPAYGFWNFEENEEGTHITWGMKGEMPFFMHFMTMFFDAMAGPDFEAGLQGLKEKCESLPSRSSEASIVDVPEQHYLFIEATCTMNEVSATIGATYGELFAYLSQNEIIPIGMPFNWWISSPFLTFVRLSLKDSGCCVVVNTSPNTTPLASSNTINYLYFQFQLID